MESRARQISRVILTAAAIIVATILPLLLLARLSGIIKIVANVMVYIILVSIVLVQTKWIEKKGFASLGFAKGKIGRQIVVGVLLSFVTCFLFVLVPMLLGAAKEDVLNRKPVNAYSLLSSAAFYMLFVGPGEEIIFRGYFFERLKTATGSGFIAVLASSLLFGFWHYPNTGSLLTVLMTTLIGVIFSLARLKIKNCSTLSVAAAHGLYDTFILLLSWFLL